MHHKKLPSKIVILYFTVFSMLHLHSMEISSSATWLEILPHNKQLDVPDNFIQESLLLKDLQKEFPEQGTLGNPIQVILNATINSLTIKKFIESQPPENLIEQIHHLSLAYYFNTPNNYSKEIAIKQVFNKLEFEQALEHAQIIDEAKLSLPPSFMHRLVADTITELFIITNSLKLAESKPLNLSLYDEKIATLQKKILEFEANKPHDKRVHWIRELMPSVCKKELIVKIYTDYTKKNLLYFSYALNEPIILQHKALIKQYLMNYKGDKILVYTDDHTLIAWDKTQNFSYPPDHHTWSKTIVNITEYHNDSFQIIFSNNGKLFASLDDKNLKVWNSTTNTIVAHYLTKKWPYSGLGFFAHDTQILLITSWGGFKIFDIATYSITEEWLDEETFRAYRSHEDIRLNKSLVGHYYLTPSYSILFNNYHQKLIKINQKSLQLPAGKNLEPLKGEFSKDGSLVLSSENTSDCFIFDLVGLDTILQKIAALTLSQAVALLFFSKNFITQNKNNSSLQELLNTLPDCIKDLLHD